MIRNAYPMRRIRQHLQRLHSILLQRTMEHQEPSKCQAIFNSIAMQLVDLPTSGQLVPPVANQHTRTFSTLILSIFLIPSASTLLPRLVNHLYVSSYPSGTTFNIPLIVSGAPFAATKICPCGVLAIVDMRFKADENWKRRRMWRVVR